MGSRKVVLITGANSGVGYEAAKAFFNTEKAYHVVITSRSLERGRIAVESLHRECPGSKNTLELLKLDLTSDESIEKAFEQVSTSKGHLDALVNNAGATFDLEFVAGRISLRESFMKSYNVNVAGTQVMTWKFLPLLLKSDDPRLIFVTGLSNITKASQGPYFPTPHQPAGWPKKIDFETIGYRCSKTALNMMMVDWNHKLREDGVKVWSVGPGFLVTNLGNVPELAEKMGAEHPSAGGDIIRRVVEGERGADIGKIVVKDGISEW